MTDQQPAAVPGGRPPPEAVRAPDRRPGRDEARHGRGRAVTAPALGASGTRRNAGPEGRLRAAAEERTGCPCVVVRSGRLALYLALRHWFQPGDRLLMSPITDDVVLFVVLAAGLRPVGAPVSPWTGNIDVAAVPDDIWTSVAGVLTANLYGLPDPVIDLRERCDRHGLTLVEDACHAIDTTVGGRPVGTFGSGGRVQPVQARQRHGRRVPRRGRGA